MLPTFQQLLLHLLEWLWKIQIGKASLVGMVAGPLAGLASIMPAAVSVDPLQALLIGTILVFFVKKLLML